VESGTEQSEGTSIPPEGETTPSASATSSVTIASALKGGVPHIIGANSSNPEEAEKFGSAMMGYKKQEVISVKSIMQLKFRCVINDQVWHHVKFFDGAVLAHGTGKVFTMLKNSLMADGATTPYLTEKAKWEKTVVPLVRSVINKKRSASAAAMKLKFMSKSILNEGA